MTPPPKRKAIHPAVAAIIIVALLAIIAAIYYYGTAVPIQPAAGGGGAKPGAQKRVGEQAIGPKDARVKIQAFVHPRSSQAPVLALKSLAAKYPNEVSLYVGSPNMAVGSSMGAAEGDIFVNGKKVASGGDAEAVRKMLEQQLGAPAPGDQQSQPAERQAPQ